MRARCSRLVALALLAAAHASAARAQTYAWLERPDPAHSLLGRIAPPPGFERVPVPEDNFAGWLRLLPLKPGRPPVLLFDGREKARQDVHDAVVDLDVGRRDLQQCADAVIRLRAEYLYARGQRDAVAFEVTSGDAAEYRRWARGDRPVVRDGVLRWRRAAAQDDSRRSFRRFLDVVFAYAGSISLARQTEPAPEPIAPGDVFVQGGSPGHAVLVLDVAAEARSGRRVFLLAQSYMPAQELHVLRVPGRDGPWYDAAFGETLATPEWTFHRGDRRRFAR